MTGPNAPNAGGQLLVAEHLLDHAEALRQHHGAEQSLDDPSCDQHFRVLGQRADQRRER